MATPLPIVCTLDAATLRDRGAEMAALGRDALLSASFDGGSRARLRFRASAADRLEALVTAERECCAWLGLSLAPAGFDAIELTLSAPPGGEAAMREFAAALGATAT
jgi:hypothetical protein